MLSLSVIVVKKNPLSLLFFIIISGYYFLILIFVSFHTSFFKVLRYEDLVLNHDRIGTQLRQVGLGDVDPRKLFRFDRTPAQVLW